MSSYRRLMRRLARPRSRPESDAPFTARYEGPDWAYRRQRVLERLQIDMVIDVGANQGQYAVDVRRGGYGGRIASMEPSSDQFARLEATSSNDDLWSVHQLALGAEPGTATLHVAANEGKSSSLLPQKDLHFGTTETMRYVDTETVEVQTIENIAPTIAGQDERILLKVDVQGVELDVIRGAGSLLPRVLAVEIELGLLPMYESQPDWRAVLDAMDDWGFTLFALDPGYSDWESGRLIEMDGLFVRDGLAEIGRDRSAAK